jgi:hypothetical protein
MRENTDRWKELCAQAAVEQNPKKLLQLAKQINELLSGKQNRLEHQDDKAQEGRQ